MVWSRTVSSQIVEITSTVRDQTKHVNTTVDDVVGKTNAQLAKVDEMVSAVIGSIAHAGATVQSGVSKPVRKVNGLLQGLKVGVETLFRSESRRSPATYRNEPSPRPDVRVAPRANPAEPEVAEFRRAPTTVVPTEELVEQPVEEDQAIHPPPTTSSSP